MVKKQKYYQRPDSLFEAIRTINGKRVAFRGKTCREVDRKMLEYREEVSVGRSFSVVADEWEHPTGLPYGCQPAQGPFPGPCARDQAPGCQTVHCGL